MRKRTGSIAAPSMRGGGSAGGLVWVEDRGPALLLAATLWLVIASVVISWDNFSAPAIHAVGATVAAAPTAPAANPVLRVLKIAMISAGAFFTIWRAPLAWLLLRKINLFFLAFLVLAISSTLWSIDPGATVARFVGVIAGGWFAFAFCLASWHARRFQRVVTPILVILLFASLIFGIVAPQQAIDDNLAGWHGLASQKNPFGMLAAFGVVLCTHAWIAGEVPLRRAIFGISVSTICLVLSRSATSMLATLLTLAFFWMLLRTPPNMRRYSRYIVIAFTILVLTYALAILKLIPGLDTLLLGPITAITGKDMTFSNRAEIWDIVKEHIQYHPLLGTGFGAFWTSPTPASQSYVFLLRMWFWPTESHNGYLEIVNDLGFVGLIVLMGYLIVFVRQSLQLYAIDRSQGALFLGLFFHQAIINLSESCWLAANGGLPGFLMTLATIALARGLVDNDIRRIGTVVLHPPASPVVRPRVAVRLGARR